MTDYRDYQHKEYSLPQYQKTNTYYQEQNVYPAPSNNYDYTSDSNNIKTHYYQTQRKYAYGDNYFNDDDYITLQETEDPYNSYQEYYACI